MARSGIVGSIASMLLGTLILLQLVAAIRIPQQPGSDSHWNSGRAEDDVFLLGAGKADITGY